MFTGDVLFRDAVGGGPADVVHDSVMDGLMTLSPELRVLPGHTDETTIGREWEVNPFVTYWRGVDAVARRDRPGGRRRRRARRLVARLRRQGQGARRLPSVAASSTVARAIVGGRRRVEAGRLTRFGHRRRERDGQPRAPATRRYAPAVGTYSAEAGLDGNTQGRRQSLVRGQGRGHQGGACRHVA